jgi:hypothetical protein
MRLAAALVAIVLAAGTGLLAREPAPLTKVTARAMPREALARRLFGDLGRIMLPAFFRGAPGARPTRPLDSLEFLTIPTATNSPGLCASSAVTVRFAPDGPLAGGDTPVRPTGIETSQFYVVADLGRLRRRDELGEAERRRLNLDCAAIDPREVSNISAPAEYMLVADLRILADLLEAARAGHTAMRVNCTVARDAPPVSESACLQRLAQLDIRRVSMVDRCEPPSNGGACFSAAVEDTSVRFESDSMTAPPSRVFVEPLIVVADQRID